MAVQLAAQRTTGFVAQAPLPSLEVGQRQASPDGRWALEASRPDGVAEPAMRVTLTEGGRAVAAVEVPESVSAAVVGDGGHAALFGRRGLWLLRPDGSVEVVHDLRFPLRPPRIDASGRLVVVSMRSDGLVDASRLDLTTPGARLRRRARLLPRDAVWLQAALLALWLGACVVLYERRSVVGALVAIGVLVVLLASVEAMVVRW